MIEEFVGTGKDERNGAEYTVYLIQEFLPEPSNPHRRGEPYVRILSGQNSPKNDYYAWQFVNNPRGFHVASPWPPEPDLIVISREDHARLAEEVRAKVCGTRGEFKTVWVPYDPNLPF